MIGSDAHAADLQADHIRREGRVTSRIIGDGEGMDELRLGSLSRRAPESGPGSCPGSPVPERAQGYKTNSFFSRRASLNLFFSIGICGLRPGLIPLKKTFEAIFRDLIRNENKS